MAEQDRGALNSPALDPDGVKKSRFSWHGRWAGICCVGTGKVTGQVTLTGIMQKTNVLNFYFMITTP